MEPKRTRNLPDLILHSASAYLAAKGMRLLAPAAVLGALIPDLLRAPGLWNMPAWHFFGPLHEPLPVLMACICVSALFQRSYQGQALAGLVSGAILHLILDMGQDHLGFGYYPLFPFSRTSFEFGIYPPEGFFWVGPLLLAGCLIAGKLRSRG